MGGWLKTAAERYKGPLTRSVSSKPQRSAAFSKLEINKFCVPLPVLKAVPLTENLIDYIALQFFISVILSSCNIH